jgi:hypothetical protein
MSGDDGRVEAGRMSSASTHAGQCVGETIKGSTPRARLAPATPSKTSQTRELGPPIVPKAAPTEATRLRGTEPELELVHAIASAEDDPVAENVARVKSDGGGPESASPTAVVVHCARKDIGPGPGHRLSAMVIVTAAVESESVIRPAGVFAAYPVALSWDSDAAGIACVDMMSAKGRREGLGV